MPSKHTVFTFLELRSMALPDTSCGMESVAGSHVVAEAPNMQRHRRHFLKCVCCAGEPCNEKADIYRCLSASSLEITHPS